jgi:hypothetical protein
MRECSLYGNQGIDGQFNYGCYFLNEDKSYRQCSLEDWQNQRRTTEGLSMVSDIVDEHWVSTVWVGIDRGFDMDKPLVFETMVFPDRNVPKIECYCERYSTYEDAIKGHIAACEWVRQQKESKQ